MPEIPVRILELSDGGGTRTVVDTAAAGDRWGIMREGMVADMSGLGGGGQPTSGATASCSLAAATDSLVFPESYYGED